jgi:hypothetical protein
MPGDIMKNWDIETKAQAIEEMKELQKNEKK